jgi:hypothetical protein
MTLTVDSLLEIIRQVKHLMPPDMVLGRIICSDAALKETRERLFPASRHRSKRIHKKLVKRFGGEFRKVPAIFRLSNGDLVAHPALYREIQRAVPKWESAGVPFQSYWPGYGIYGR